MAGKKYTSDSSVSGLLDLGGGLNSTASALNLKDNEMSDLLNVDFDVFGSIKKRNGYAKLNSSAINSGATCVGLYDTKISGTQYLIGVFGNKIYKMDALDGTWDDITETQAVTFTGTGLNDATSGGTFTAVGDIEYKIVIDAAAIPDTFEWFKDGVSQAAGVAITGAAQNLDNGLTITFAATTGHTANDYWIIHPATTITAGNNNLMSFATLDDFLVATNNVNPPIMWDGSGNVFLADGPTGLQTAKFVTVWNNYMFYANVKVSSVNYYSRFYWCNLKDPETWTATDWIDVEPGDGNVITGIMPLGDRLVIFKNNSIHNIFFTGDSEIPFIRTKSQSDVGAISGYSIQRVTNGLMFLNYDGIYFYDGNNSIKASDRISTTLQSFATNRFQYVTSGTLESKNTTWWSFTTSGGSTHNRIVTYNSVKDAFSIYSGIAANAIVSLRTSSDEERIYFGDYSGYAYRADYGSNDNPAGTETAINGYFKTKWFHFGNIVDKKGVLHITIYYQFSSSHLNISHSWDLDTGDQFTQSFFIGTNETKWDSFLWDDGIWASEGGTVKRIELNGRGRVLRIHIGNKSIDESFQIDGIGFYPHEETVK